MQRELRLLVAIFLSVIVSGCSPHLAGTNDALLEYVIDPDPATGQSTRAQVAAAAVKARLSAAQIMADVDASGGAGVQVVVDADAVAAVDSLLAWRGGLRAYLVQGAALFSPTSPTAPPVVDLGVGQATIDSIEPALHGRALALSLSEDAREAFLSARSAHPDGRIALVRGHTLLGTVPIAQALATPLVIVFGDDITAYSRASRTRLLLGTPLLPLMRRVSAERMPARWGLAAACALLPCALSLAWLAFVRRFDRARPEPLWLVLATFGLGAVSVVPAGIAELAFDAASPWLDPSFVTFGGQLWALPFAVAVCALVVGLPEEGSKWLGVWSLARRRREFDEPVDGIVYGCAAALGFAAAENVKYFAFGRMSGAVIALRGFVTVPAHMFFGAIWGYAMGQELVSRRTRVLPFLALSALAHGAFDAILSTDGIQLVATILVLGLAVAFVTMLQRALRHGVVWPRQGGGGAPPVTEPVPASLLRRESFRIGSPVAFYGCAAGMVLSAFAITVLGAAYELLHHRAGFVFVGVATTTLALFGLAAYGASSTIPLDFVIDAQGVTFAGSRTPWRAIVGFELEALRGRTFVLLRSTQGTMRIGPTDESTARELTTCLRSAQGPA